MLRCPRPAEKDGVHYHFATKDQMSAAITKGEFIETAVFSENMYGTSKKAVEAGELGEYVFSILKLRV
ncbi:unnamed protein product [Leptosia nina]|uniref:Guanylate kinase-like domain-containing protein n=1 Tax=Leptosia nina TaxID=320188 RepID=A0AAV1JWL8_9NEOP